jgi:hypothetical protein
MTVDQLERAVEFLLEHHSKFSVDMDLLKEAQREAQKQQREAQERHNAEIADLREVQRQQAETVAAMGAEMREYFDKLIIANEVTRDLANRVGELALATSQRVTNLEHKSNDGA